MTLRSYFRQLRDFDWLMVAAMLLLSAFSLAALYGIASGKEPPDYLNLFKQLFFIFVGLLVMVVVASISVQRISQSALVGYVLGVVLLVAVLIFGRTLSGTTGWFTVFGASFQPVELGKLALIVMLARVFSEPSAPGALRLRTLAVSGALTGMYFILTVLQPDLGSALLLLLCWAGMAVVAGMSRRQAGIILVAVILGAALAWTTLLQNYQRDRIMSFLNPSADPYFRGYQVQQSIIAVGSGQLFGRGLGLGSQSQLKFIPAAQTDFIFAVIAEELGFFGAMLVMTAYAVLFVRLAAIIRRASTAFGGYLVTGISVVMFSQVTINIGMNLGVLPVTGIGLPLLSYGGSYLVTTFALLGLAQGVAIASVKYRT
ncbi:MAG: FtsW/RodA/SpoVE family cell cycle protein [Patescibacteria group bacterium]|nr:FtsW/RodA/SpoVE family cell cycle protein [Patescibacteria group bacterium]